MLVYRKCIYKRSVLSFIIHYFGLVECLVGVGFQYRWVMGDQGHVQVRIKRELRTVCELEAGEGRICVIFFVCSKRIE